MSKAGYGEKTESALDCFFHISSSYYMSTGWWYHWNFFWNAELHRVRQTVNSESRLAARIEYITRRNRGSENRIQILLIDTNELIDISIAKIFTLEMKSGDAVYVLKSVSGENYYLCDYIRYHKATIWLRILIFIFCIGLSILFAFGTVSILRAKKEDK